MTFALSACSGKPSAVAPQGGGAAYSSASSELSGGNGRPGGIDPRDRPIPQVNGKPLWAPNRNHTAEENAQYQFAKNGGDFGAKSESDYVAKAHAFVDRPPRDAETLDRPNGDKLIYDPRGNVFAVMARNGAPRTMFKPRGGASYWTQQKDRQTSQERTGGGEQS
jgi:hypothetical protein